MSKFFSSEEAAIEYKGDDIQEIKFTILNDKTQNNCSPNFLYACLIYTKMQIGIMPLYAKSSEGDYQKL